MSSDTKLLTWLVIGVFIVSLFGVWGAWQDSQSLSKDEVKGIVAQELANMPQPTDPPSAQEIADLVVVPEAPEVESADNELLNDFLQDEYAEEFEEIEDAAEDDFFAEIQDDDEEELEDEFEGLFDFLEANIEGFKELTDVDEEDVDVTVKLLGLKEDADKSAEVVVEFTVEYSKVDAPINDEWEATVFVSGLVTYEEGDFGDEEVTDLLYALE